MNKKYLVILLSILFISSCGNGDNKEFIDNTEKQAIVSEIKVDEKGLGTAGNSGKIDVKDGFNN